MYLDKRQAHFIYLCIDIFCIGASFYFSYYFRHNLDFLPVNTAGVRPYSLVFLLWGVSLIFFLHNFRLYTTDRSATIPYEGFQVFKAVMYSAIMLSVVIFSLKIEFFSRIIFSAVAACLFISLSGWRALKRIAIRQMIARGYNNFNVLIVGAGKSGKELADEILQNRYLGLKIAGFLDDYKTEAVNGYQVLGKIEELEKIVQEKFIDDVYVTIPSQRAVVSKIIPKIIKLGRTIRVLVDSFEIPVSRVKITNIGFMSLISYYERGAHGTDSPVKRIIDFVVAGILLIALLPLFLAIVFFIKLDSPGPVLYVSRRSGRRGRPFNFYKFRSMHQDADEKKESLRHISEVRGPIFKIRNDPRITRIGRILRRYSLDELPQLINVLKGDMSLVGPRPLPVDESNQCEAWQLRRLEIKPGLACLAQVRGRSDISFYKWMKWDLWYIDNWSLRLDSQVLFWMIPAVLKRRGAY